MVLFAALASTWRPGLAASAGFWSFLLLCAWRALANLASLNQDFMPAVSIGDVGCLVAGSAAPYLLGRIQSVSRWQRQVPVVVGALVGFVVNVVIL
jgi:hypothetical protein